jgi:hypothetical protein
MEHQVRPQALEWPGDTFAEPICIKRMDASLIEKSVPAYVIPMDVRGHYDDRQLGEGAHDLAKVGDTGPAVHERGTLGANEQVAMDMLPMTVFGYSESGFVDRLNAEPVRRCCSDHC